MRLVGGGGICDADVKEEEDKGDGEGTALLRIEA